jgi:hypothetical protein
MYIYTSLLRMTDTMTYQNIDLSSCDTLYSEHYEGKELVVRWKPVGNDVSMRGDQSPLLGTITE